MGVVALAILGGGLRAICVKISIRSLCKICTHTDGVPVGKLLFSARLNQGDLF